MRFVLLACVCFLLGGCASYTNTSRSHVKPATPISAVCMAPLDGSHYGLSFSSRYDPAYGMPDAKKRVEDAIGLYRKQIPLQLSARLKAVGVNATECPKDVKSASGKVMDFRVVSSDVRNEALGLWKTDLTIFVRLVDQTTKPTSQWDASIRTGNILNSFVAPDESNVAAFVDSVMHEMRKEGWL